MTETTVREIATAHPAAVRVFEKYGIDYCCGGQKPLADACREHGLSEDAVLDEVRSSERPGAAERDWAGASLAELIGHIVVTHHGYLSAELPALEQRMAKVVEKHGANHSELGPLQQVLTSLKAELMHHCRKEEMVLFPFTQQIEAAANEGRRISAPFGTVANPIRMMEHEHDDAGRALAAIRKLTNNYEVPADACPTFRALYEGLAALERDLHQHIHLENNILFPRAQQLERALG